MAPSTTSATAASASCRAPSAPLTSQPPAPPSVRAERVLGTSPRPRSPTARRGRAEGGGGDAAEAVKGAPLDPLELRRRPAHLRRLQGGHRYRSAPASTLAAAGSARATARDGREALRWPAARSAAGWRRGAPRWWRVPVPRAEPRRPRVSSPVVAAAAVGLPRDITSDLGTGVSCRRPAGRRRRCRRRPARLALPYHVAKRERRRARRP